MLASIRRSLSVVQALWTRISRRAAAAQITRLEVLQTILTEGLDTWDRLDAGKRRPRTTRMRKPKSGYMAQAEGRLDRSASSTEPVQ